MKTLLTVADCYELSQKVDAQIDIQLDAILAMEEAWRREIARTSGLYARLLEAYNWLVMIQRCVKTDAAVIDLPAGVSVALWDAHIL